MTLQQAVGLASAVIGAVTTSLLAAQAGGSDIPQAVTITLSAVTAGLGAATAFLGQPTQLIKHATRVVGRASAARQAHATTKAPG